MVRRKKSALFNSYLYKPETEPFFYRLPLDVAQATSVGVDKLNQECAGGRIRFSTDSPYIAIRAKFRAVCRSSHVTLISSAGFDLYIDGEFDSRFVKEFRMPYDMTDSYEQIVHGTAASRPGNIYPSIISRKMNFDHINLGFSGNAKGEPVLAEWMATLPMSVFVCDYDHNAPSVEHLAETHYAMYEIIRKKNPDVPYIMITRPNFWTTPRSRDSVLGRREVVMSSYLKARQNGDENVWFIDGMSFFADSHHNEYILDSIHPDDAGFIRMAEGIGAVICHVLEENK